MTTEQPKVYCGQCKWYRYHMSQLGVESSGYQPGREVCTHVSNVHWVDSYRARCTEQAWLPAEKNAANDCPLWEMKPKKRGFWERIGKMLIN